ncbi:hypothetical protein GCM10022251_62840 [Phytohabitans flavus]|uniref:DUF6879 domain-containing protein n=3 Tax=Phytohabitans flavus TaxID=1076124 RepID=A0A6F8Y519_9ACTN|nr:hypothetical protein Pflav_076340 [Phytohabitans flavus]
MTMDELTQLLRQIERSAFRLETRSEYNAPGEAALFRAFFEGKALPPRNPETDPWLRMTADSVNAGRIWRRVHVVQRPLSRYLQFELIGYLGNQLAGEDIRIASRDDQPGPLDELNLDFWMLDDGTVFVMHYDQDNRLVDIEPATTNADAFRKQRDLALAHSIPLADYLPTARDELLRSSW